MASAITAPACFGAPSRPKAAPMPTIRIESVALNRVRNFGRRPAWNQIAAVMSMPLALDRRVISNWPAPVSNPAAVSTTKCFHGGAWEAACSRSSPAPPQIRCCVSSSRPVSAAAARPVPIPVSTTANQNPALSRRARIGWIMVGAPAGVGERGDWLL